MKKEEFIERSRSLHGYKYVYIDLPEKITRLDKINMIFKGVTFSQVVNKHLNGKCPEKSTVSRSTSEFIFLGTMINLSWIQVFIGKDFRSGLQVVPLLLMANFFLGVFFNLSIWYKLTNQTRYGAWLTIFGAVITLAGNFIFIPRFGYMACAYTTLVCYLLMMLVSYFIGNKHYHVNYDVKRIVAYIGLSLLLFAISQYINFDSDLLDITIKNLLLILFALVVFLFERKELRFQ